MRVRPTAAFAELAVNWHQDRGPIPPAVIAALERALDSDARNGAAAAEAASVLVRCGYLDGEDPRYFRILDRAPPRNQVALLGVASWSPSAGMIDVLLRILDRGDRVALSAGAIVPEFVD